jgi:holo-[acyl-carrier protein] synthase
VRDDSGAPLLLLHGQHACAAAELGIETLHVSISHTQAFATAVVVAEG